MQKITELISEDITERILEKLNEIEKSSNLSNLDISAILDKIPAESSKEFVTNQNELWKDVSKLSVDFYLDFEYYKQFTFQSKFSCAEYHDALKNIGFKEINGFWKSYCKPSKTLVINYVVQSCIYRTIMMKMNGIDSVDEVMTINNTSELIGSCPFCDKNLNSVHNCEACGATAEEIENLRNQAKLIENKHNPSVGGGIEVVENDLLCTEHVDSVNITGNSLINSDNNNNDNTNENSKSIPNINFSEEIINKQKINRGTQCGIDREKDGRTESCICCDGKCEERNDGNELYCTYCGLCLENSCKEKSCNNSCSEEPRVTNEYSRDEEPSDDYGHVGEQESSLPNSHNEEPLGESHCVDTPDNSELVTEPYFHLMSDDQIDTELKEDVKKVFEKNSDNIHYVYDILRPDQKLNIKVAYNQEEVVYQKLLKSKKAAQIALNLYNANDIYKDLKILTESDLKNPCENEKPEDTNNSDLENPCENEYSNNSCFKKPEAINESDSNNLHGEVLSDDHDRVGEQESSLENESKDKSCNNPRSEEPKVPNKSYSNNLHNEELNDEDDHLVKSKSSLSNPHNEEPLGESLCVDTPDKSEVIDKLYQYVFYFLIARNLEIINIYKTTVGKERSGNLTCQFCDTNISSNDLECSGCGESLLTIYKEEIDNYEKSKEIKNNKNRDTDSVANKEVINSDDKKHDKESGSQNLDDKHGPVNSDGIKWKCKRCEFVNEDGNVNCTVCMEARAEWNCRKCTFANQISSEKCKICEEFRENKANDNNNNNNDDNIEKDGRTESWICWNGECKERNDGNELYCKKCGVDKSASRERGATVDVNINGKIEQVRICCKCDNINDLYRSSCDKCFEFKVGGKDESINKDDNKNIEKDGKTASWTCWYRLCKTRNDGNELYCKKCGLDKSANREKGATVDIMRYGKIEQVWICYECDNINYDLNKSICGRCFESKIDVKSESDHDKDKLLYDYEVIQSDDDKWKCKKCKSVNDRESLSCKQCQSPRIEMWSCEHCTMRNQISDNYCAACGEENVNKIIKSCSNCKQKEIICDDLCEDCLKARVETWTCSYRLCENRNAGNVKYCKDCGLDRYADKINIGKPMWRCKDDVRDQIWICDKCFIINDISNNPYFCQKHYCYGENKYRKRCYKCEYKYNYKSNKYCEICVQKLY